MGTRRFVFGLGNVHETGWAWRTQMVTGFFLPLSFSFFFSIREKRAPSPPCGDWGCWLCVCEGDGCKCRGIMGAPFSRGDGGVSGVFLFLSPLWGRGVGANLSDISRQNGPRGFVHTHCWCLPGLSKRASWSERSASFSTRRWGARKTGE